MHARSAAPVALLITVAFLIAGLGTVARSQQQPTPIAVWRTYLGADAGKPAAAELPHLLAELNTMLGSPDPQLRDDIAYGLLSKWILRDRIVPVAARRTLLRAWSKQLGEDFDQQNGVLKRSFSALALSTLVALDNEDPYLERREFDGLVDDAIAYLKAERDVRGYDEQLGWLHSVAHTADLMKFLGRSRLLEPRQQRLLLDAITDKLTATEQVFVAGEDERLARAMLAIAARRDFDEAAFATALDRLVGARYSGSTGSILVRKQNRQHVLVSLFALLSLDERQLPSMGQARTLVGKALGS